MQVVLRVEMMCEGCVGAVKRILGKMEGTYPFVTLWACFFLVRKFLCVVLAADMFS